MNADLRMAIWKKCKNIISKIECIFHRFGFTQVNEAGLIHPFRVQMFRNKNSKLEIFSM